MMRPHRRQSVVLICGCVVASTAITAFSGAGVWTIARERQLLKAGTRTLVESTGAALATGLDALLKSERKEVQAILTNAASTNGLSRCRIVDAKGFIVADAVPPKVAVRRGGQERLAAEPVPASEAMDPTIANASIELRADEFGAARLELSAVVPYPRWTSREVMAGLSGVSLVSLGVLGWAAVQLRGRLRSAGAIGRALLAMERGETSPAALAVSARFGAEARAWNQLLAEREQQRKHATVERARETLGNKGDSKSDLPAACDALWQGLVITDEHLRVRYANGAAAILLRAKRDGMVGASLEEYIKDAAALELLRASKGSAGRHRTTMELKQAESGGVLRLGVRAVRREDSQLSLVVMIEDITQQRVADEARNSFVAQATHELRTPLTNIRLYVEQAIDAGEDDAALRAQCLDVINQESRRLERIVGDMLSVSEIEAGSFRLRTGDVRLETVFEELKSDFAPQAKDKQIDLKFDLPPKLPSIKGDRDKIVLAVHNLMGNALKYTPRGGSVRVRVTVDARALVVEVTDTGIGINPDETELIFEKFYRAKDKRVENITGTGLGLALAREVVRLHGGDISVKSELNKGSTFTLSVPTMAEAA